MEPEVVSAKAKIGILDYGSGNVRSVANAVAHLGHEVVLSHDEEVLRECDRLILPGVGSFRAAMDRLGELRLVPILENLILAEKKPYLGICVGMQILADFGEEFGEHRGLGWIRGRTRKLDVQSQGLRLPHIGWNELERPPSDFDVFRDLPPRPTFYFVHSYALCPEEQVTVAYCTYGVRFAAAVRKGNITGVQFHPEKSQHDGLNLLENFCSVHA